jgi:hypothetical protein
MPADARMWLMEQYADEVRRLEALTNAAPPWRWDSSANVAVSA